jgi:toxin ParE1/3/4
LAAVAWTLQALEDLEAACLYIARDSPRIAALFAERVFEATDRLAEFPASGRKVPESGRDDVREVFVMNYRVIYRLRSGDVEILTVHHGSRLLGPL